MKDVQSRIAGVALAVGASATIVILLLGQFEGAVSHGSANSLATAAGWVQLPATLLIVLSLPAVVSRIAERSLVLSVVGFAGVVTGVLIYQFALAVIGVAVVPFLIAHHVFANGGPPDGDNQV